VIGVGVANFCMMRSCALLFLIVETLRCIPLQGNMFVAGNRYLHR
jgi:hypothetical protein